MTIGDCPGLDWCWLGGIPLFLLAGASLCLLIVGWCLVVAPIDAKANVGPSEAETMGANLVHEISVAKFAIEPEIISQTDFIPVSRFKCHPVSEIDSILIQRKHIRFAGFDELFYREFGEKSISGFLGQNIANSKSVKNFNRRGSSFSVIEQQRLPNITLFDALFSDLTVTMAERIWLYANDGEFKPDHCASRTIGSFCGNPIYAPHLLAGLPQGPSEPSDRDSGDGRNNIFPVVQLLADEAESNGEWGAVFIIGLIILSGVVAYTSRKN
jgi:hypothetical protein